MKRKCSIQTPLGQMNAMVEHNNLCGLRFVGQKHEPEDAGDLVRKIAVEGDVVLFKGSRGTRVERALERFTQ